MKVLTVLKKDPVLAVSGVLAVLSMFSYIPTQRMFPMLTTGFWRCFFP